MKFGDKYELLESLTTGGVETFVANDKIRGERVLVHILHCDPQRANQPTVQWVLESFRRVAPEPVGLVLETGRYSGTLYAYVVTKLPEETALAAWVRQYEAQARDTAEVPAPPAPPTPESLAPTAEQTPPPPSPAPSSVTQLLREFDTQAKPDVPIAPPKPIIQPPQPPPSFGISSDRSGVRMAAPPTWNAEAPRIPVAPKAEPPRSSPPDTFPPNFLDKNFDQSFDKNFPPETSVPPAKDSPKLGEFTSFFQGPFRGDRPSETPQISPPHEPPRKTVGDFTAMFGAVKPQPPEEPLPTKGIAGNESPGTGFTGFFNPNADLPSRTPSAPSGPLTPLAGLPRAAVDSPVFPDPPNPPQQTFVPPPPISYVPPDPPIFRAPAPPIPPMPSLPTVLPSTLPSDGATRAFSQPGSEPTPAAPLLPVGPSAYTQIISVRPPSPAADAAGAPKTLTPPAFTAPPLPKLPPPPPMPVFAAPAPPPLPKAPKVEIPQPPVSYWPLVLTLTVSFVIAVLLLLYFWLKH